MIRAPTDHQTGGPPRTSSLVAQFQVKSGERAAAGDADAARGGGGVGLTQRMQAGEGTLHRLIRSAQDDEKASFCNRV
jgi:hypothetical protein